MLFFVHDLTNRIKTPIRPKTSFPSVEEVSEIHESKAIHEPPTIETVPSEPKARSRQAKADTDQYTRNTTAKDIMSSPILAVKKSSTISHALQLIDAHSLHHLVIVDDNDLIEGLVSKELLYKAANRNDLISNLPPIYTLPVISTNNSTPATSVAAMMLENGFEAILVLQDNDVLGIITATNFLKLVAENAVNINIYE